MTHTYQAHGLCIESDIPLPMPPGKGTPNLTLYRGEDREIPHERPPGERLAEVARPNQTIFYTLSRGSDTVLRYAALCDFHGDRDFARITVHKHPDADEALLPILVAGAVVAIHLTLHQALVLHASAVATNGSAIAFVGSSGMGKSTLAAALCNLGCALLTDDVLRVENGLAHPGGTENRLRDNARQLAMGDTYETADGRLAGRPPTLAAAPLPLAACVVPRPSREVTEVALRRLGPAEALIRLSRYPRVLGWRDAASMAVTFQALADLVEGVPVFEAKIP
ncbi:MAG: hypothetical protein M3422_15535, partial [Actinomycetota bacterium]|nr:hypothetical protein [Actinomycetota bacterium]